MGNTVTPSSEPGGQATVQTSQEINPGVLGKVDNFYNKPGASTVHEVVESYLGGKVSQASGVSVGSAATPGGKAVYNQVHPLAPPQSGAFRVDSYNQAGQQIKYFDPKGCSDIYVEDANRKVIIQSRP